MRANDLPEMDELFPVRFNVLSYSEIKKRPLRSVTDVGGGNVAMDAARCAKRLGAEQVYIVYRLSLIHI